MVKLADTPDLGSGAAMREGSSPFIRTIFLGTSMNFIFQLIKANKLRVIFFLFFSILTSLLGVGTLAYINTYLLKSGNEDYLYIVYFIILLLVFFASSLFVEIKLAKFGQNFIFKMQRRLVKQILDTPFLKIEQISKAKLLASLNNDVRTISFGLLRLPDFIQSLILIIASSFYLYYLSAKIFLLCSIFVLIILIIDYRFMIKTYGYFRKSRDSDDALQKNYENIIDGRKELSLNSFRAKLYYEEEFEKNADEKRHSNVMSNVFQSLSSNFTNIGFLALVGLEFYLSLHFGWSSLENATTIAIAILFLRTPLMVVMGAIPTLLMAKVALDKIENLDLINYQAGFTLIKHKPQWQSLRFENVSFHYDEKFSLSPTSLEIHKGELIFLIGKNGSGKSTFSMLLAALISPDAGFIYLDQMQIKEENKPLYRSLITAIFSDFHLFTQTLVDENLARDEKIHSWLEILELQNKTRIENGKLAITKLSTGQRKRLAMLIALLEERDILILDEFAADQDPIFRRFFYTKLLPLLKKQGKTVLAISHDERYFDLADRIFLAQNGVISELKGEDKTELARNLVDKF